MEVRGIPDESAVPSLMMNYQTVATVSPRVGATGTWSLDGQLIPNPLSFGAASYTDSVGIDVVEFINAQITGVSHSDRLTTFLSDMRRWRLAYASVTIYQDGPDLSNQGTVVVCQKPVSPTRFNVPDFVGLTARQHASYMDQTDLPSYNVSQGMPNAYFGKSRDGVYIPLKLTRTHQTWHSARDLIYQANSATRIAYTDPLAGGQLNLAVPNPNAVINTYPFLSMNDLHLDVATTTPQGTLTSEFCNDCWADYSFRNMSVATSLSFFFRFGFEVQCTPNSNLAPHLKLSPAEDEAALSTYFAIARELKDGYPADYNDLGKIWDVISSIAKKVSPFLNMIPVAGPALAQGIPFLAEAGDSVRAALRRTSAPTKGSIASASDKETARAVIGQAQVEAAKRRIGKVVNANKKKKKAGRR